jgi:hypothetical protein
MRWRPCIDFDNRPYAFLKMNFDRLSLTLSIRASLENARVRVACFSNGTFKRSPLNVLLNRQTRDLHSDESVPRLHFTNTKPYFGRTRDQASGTRVNGERSCIHILRKLRQPQHRVINEKFYRSSRCNARALPARRTSILTVIKGGINLGTRTAIRSW